MKPAFKVGDLVESKWTKDFFGLVTKVDEYVWVEWFSPESWRGRDVDVAGALDQVLAKVS